MVPIGKKLDQHAVCFVGSGISNKWLLETENGPLGLSTINKKKKKKKKKKKSSPVCKPHPTRPPRCVLAITPSCAEPRKLQMTNWPSGVAGLKQKTIMLSRTAPGPVLLAQAVGRGIERQSPLFYAGRFRPARLRRNFRSPPRPANAGPPRPPPPRFRAAGYEWSPERGKPHSAGPNSEETTFFMAESRSPPTLPGASAKIFLGPWPQTEDAGNRSGIPEP